MFLLAALGRALAQGRTDTEDTIRDSMPGGPSPGGRQGGRAIAEKS